MREVSKKLIVAREKTLMPQVYRWIHRNFDDQEFRFLLPEEIADMVREEQPERFYQDRKAEVRKRRESGLHGIARGGDSGHVRGRRPGNGSGRIQRRRRRALLYTGASRCAERARLWAR